MTAMIVDTQNHACCALFKQCSLVWFKLLYSESIILGSIVLHSLQGTNRVQTCVFTIKISFGYIKYSSPIHKCFKKNVTNTEQLLSK